MNETPAPATRARVIETFDEGEPEEEPLAVSRLRKHASTFLSDTDKRYMGRATSRKALQEESEESVSAGEEGDSGEEEEDSGADGDPEEELEESSEEGQQDSDSGEQELKALVRKMKSNDLELPKVTDFEKFTEGMDDIGDSDDDDDEEEEESEEESEEEGMEEEEDGAVMTFSEEKVGEEVKKGKAVKKQIALWDQLLEGRIKLQKALLTANQLPQPETFPAFKMMGGAEMAGALKNSYKALKALQRSLAELQDELLYQHPDTKHLIDGKKAKADRVETILRTLPPLPTAVRLSDRLMYKLLRELIEKKTSALDANDQVAMGRQWLAIQKLRSKIKKKMDTKASKGRKVRFHAHSKLVNFMAPIDHSTMNDDARSPFVTRIKTQPRSDLLERCGQTQAPVITAAHTLTFP
ncbi:UNVERIFIED_CONTAM: hypothetical protein FKN15_029474 [Acipenser sinensis]